MGGFVGSRRPPLRCLAIVLMAPLCREVVNTRQSFPHQSREHVRGFIFNCKEFFMTAMTERC